MTTAVGTTVFSIPDGVGQVNGLTVGNPITEVIIADKGWNICAAYQVALQMSRCAGGEFFHSLYPHMCTDSRVRVMVTLLFFLVCCDPATDCGVEGAMSLMPNRGAGSMVRESCT